MKRGQTEMIGLVIIVVLITLGMLFLARFSFKEKAEKKIFTRKELAASTMGALLGTTVAEGECQGRFQPKLSDVLKDCGQYYSPDGSLPSLYQCGNPVQHSCDFLKAKVQTLLGQTLATWGKTYEFRAWLLPSPTASEEEIVYILGEEPIANHGGCPGERDTSGLQPLSAGDAGLIETILYVCD